MKRRIESWGTALAVALLAGCALARFLPDDAATESASAGFHWVTYANTALAASMAMYTTHLWLRTELVGRAATALATVGALGVLAGLALGALQTGAARIGLYEGTALFSSAAVLAYLCLERAYRNRSAGIVVMSAVMLAVLCEMWLIVHGLAAPGRPPDGLAAYWEAAHRFAVSLGYCALALAGGLAAVGLARRSSGEARESVATLFAVLSVGAPVLLLGVCMGAVWAVTDIRGSNRAAGFLIVSVLATTVAMLAWARMRGQGEAQRARLVLGAFVASTAGLLVAGRVSELLG